MVELTYCVPLGDQDTAPGTSEALHVVDHASDPPDHFGGIDLDVTAITRSRVEHPENGIYRVRKNEHRNGYDPGLMLRID